jgi:chemotaxis family two-component system sensor kinase Cph1
MITNSAPFYFRFFLGYFVLTFVIVAIADGSGVIAAPTVDPNLDSSRSLPAWRGQLLPQHNNAVANNFVVDYVSNAFDTSGFSPRWRAENWSPLNGWLQIIPDAAIWLSFMFMSVLLLCFVRRRHGITKPIFFWFFAAFIIACGCTHLLDASMFWWPAYRLTGLVKATTALISLIACVLLVPAFSKALALRGSGELQREITQRRRTELELRQVHAQLEGVIEQRTAELAAKKEEMEHFLNAVSHDLKSPIVTCLGLTGILREDLKAGRVEETQDTVGRIDRSIMRMRQLIEDLLHLSRIGQVRFELGDVDTLTMIRSIGDELKPRLDKIGAMLQIGSDLPVVRADAQWLAEVFENLLNNAIKYGCDNPQPKITVGSITEDGEHRFFIRDNGRGIDPAHHAQILQPFRRLRSDKEGSGMGLAIVVRIVKMHGGRLWIESEPGHGAAFWIALPVVKASETIRMRERSVA